MGSLERRLDELKGGRDARPRSPSASRRVAHTLADTIGGRERRCGGMGYWEVAVPFRRCCNASASLDEPPGFGLECEVSRGESTRLDPRQTLVMDIETGGFSGTPVFLIGVVALDERPLLVEQWLARDYPEEEAILKRLARWARNRPNWVTFNGKSFDVPFVLERATLYGVRLAPPRAHVDLLHAARRRWGPELPDCRLETLERRILGRTRIGDVPGCDIPDLFHHFIGTGNAAPLRPVLEHNRLDLVASTELLLRIARQTEVG